MRSLLLCDGRSLAKNSSLITERRPGLSRPVFISVERVNDMQKESYEQESARLTEEAADLSEDLQVELNEKMALLQADLQEGRQPQITVTYFRPDEKKSGGEYIVREGTVKKVDPYTGMMLLTDETRIPLSGIFDMELKKG